MSNFMSFNFVSIVDDKERYTKLCNSFFTENKDGTKDKFNELYIYYYISEFKLLNNIKYALLSIHLIAYDIRLFADSSKNMDGIKKALIGLKDKGFIDFNVDEKLDYSTPILICFTKEPKNNYTKLYRWMFEASSNSKEFFIFSYIEKWANDDSHKISLLEWADNLGYSTPSSAQELLNRMEKEKKIFVRHGKYLLKDKQETNDYSLNKELLIEETNIKNNNPSSQDSDLERDENEKVMTPYGELEIKKINLKVKHSNWGKKDENGKNKRLDRDDYYIYRICKDNNFHSKKVKHWESVMDKSRQNDRYDGEFEEYDHYYNKNMNEEKEKQLLYGAKNAIHIGNKMIVLDKSNIEKYEINLDTYWYMEPDKSNKRSYKLRDFCSDIYADNDEIPDEVKVFCINMFKEHVNSNCYMSEDEAVRLKNRLTAKFTKK